MTRARGAGRPDALSIVAQVPKTAFAVATAKPVPRVVLMSQHTRRWTRLRSLKLVGAPSGATVRASCTGGGCPRSTKATRVTLEDLKGPKLRPGARITVRVSSTTIRIKIRAGRAPLVT